MWDARVAREQLMSDGVVVDMLEFAARAEAALLERIGVSLQPLQEEAREKVRVVEERQAARLMAESKADAGDRETGG